MFSYFEPLRLKNERVHVDPLEHKPFQKNKFLRYASFNKYFFLPRFVLCFNDVQSKALRQIKMSTWGRQ